MEQYDDRNGTERHEDPSLSRVRKAYTSPQTATLDGAWVEVVGLAGVAALSKIEAATAIAGPRYLSAVGGFVTPLVM